ncbi:hypothetical protein DZF79_04325 [Vibrio parahaemolyticus]|nr:hypothetical protein [Vibrio parahaemolyticus]
MTNLITKFQVTDEYKIHFFDFSEGSFMDVIINDRIGEVFDKLPNFSFVSKEKFTLKTLSNEYRLLNYLLSSGVAGDDAEPILFAKRTVKASYEQFKKVFTVLERYSEANLLKELSFQISVDGVKIFEAHETRLNSMPSDLPRELIEAVTANGVLSMDDINDKMVVTMSLIVPINFKWAFPEESGEGEVFTNQYLSSIDDLSVAKKFDLFSKL